MKARGYFWILAIVMAAALVFITIVLFRQGFSWFFMAAEILVILVMVLLFFLYKRVVKPMETIGNGMDLLREQDFSSRLGYVGQKDADRVVDTFNKMMDQLKDEKLRIREQNRFLDLLMDSSPMGVIITDFDGKITVVNPSACGMLGVEGDAVAGLSLGEISDGQLPQVLSVMEKGTSHTVRTEDGNIYKCTRASFMDRGFSHPFYLIEQMTEELHRAETKAYGQVIRMISHEVNNSMAGVASSMDTVREILEAVDAGGAGEGVGAAGAGIAAGACEAVDSGTGAAGAGMGATGGIALSANDAEDIRSLLKISSDRCISLSDFITAFASVVKIPEPQIVPVLLNEFISNRLRFFESICAGKAVSFDVKLSPGVGSVEIDPVLMEQALVNVVKNAAEAIDGEGVIRVETIAGGFLKKGDAKAGSASYIAPKGETMLVVSDNGRGITPEAAEKLFTPFFSTKANGQGIGLTLIRDILVKQKCRFSLTTGSDGWTRFTVKF